MRVGITFGTFDLLHVGHINILVRSKAVCDYLVVGVSTDELNLAKKGVAPVYSLQERMQIVGSLRMVDFVFPEESLEQKADYVREVSCRCARHGPGLGREVRPSARHMRSAVPAQDPACLDDAGKG